MDVSPVQQFANYLAARCGNSNVVIIDDLATHDFDQPYRDNDIVVVSNGIVSLERLPDRIEPLKKLLRKVGKVILSDDIDAVHDLDAVDGFLTRYAFPVEFSGYVNASNRIVGTLALLSSGGTPHSTHTPDGFRVVALIASYNEGDIIVPVVEQLHRDGIDVYLIDNWSTDDTYEKAQSLLGRGLLVGLERFPADAPSPTYEWRDLLKRKEELCLEIEADWFIHHDVDEFRESPWEGVCLRDAIYWVDQQGYNAIDFTVLNFWPVDNGYQPDSSLVDHFRFFEFGRDSGHFVQTKAWKAAPGGVILTKTGGHSAEFVGRKTFAYKFLLRHYPIRSQSQGTDKVFKDRLLRYSPSERKEGWHVHYDAYAPGAKFLKSPKGLTEFTPCFNPHFLIERLSGIGVIPLEEMCSTTRKHQMEECERNVQTLTGQLADRDRAIHALSVQVAEQNRSIQVLSAQIAEILGCRTWKIASMLQKIRVFLTRRGDRHC